MKNIIITGFEPFNAKYNPTIDIVEYFDRKHYGVNGVFGKVLPVKFGEAADILQEMIREINPYLVLSLGLSAARLDTGREDLNLELRGINIMNAKNPDANGYLPQDEKIDKAGPRDRAVFSTGFRAGDMVDILMGVDISSRTSTNPGKYVCNDLIYRTLAVLEKRNQTRFGFIHMPWLEHYKEKSDAGVNWDEKAAMPLKEVTDAVDLIIVSVLNP